MLLADSLGNGGAERQLALLAVGLPTSWQRRVCALGGGPFESHLRARGVTFEVLTRRSRLDPVPAGVLWRILAESRPDVVHSWGWISTAVAGPLCRLMGVPLIDGTIRTGALALMSDHTWLRRFGMACATTIVANTHAGLQAWGINQAKGRVVYNGFDWSRVSPDPAPGGADGAHASPARGSGGRFTVVMTGRMVPAKDYRAVIQAARLLAQEDRTWRFVLQGNGERRAELMAEAADLVDRGCVEFPEPRLEVLGQVRRAQVGVLMTDPAHAMEGCSNAVMEYMACGLPVVCSEGGGNRELVVHGTTGFLIPPSDAGQLAKKLAFLRDNETERLAMGEAGRRRIANAFSLEMMVARYVRIYEDALSASGSK
jgi:glycosyltransferase involved in cell wall biosynthesis